MQLTIEYDRRFLKFCNSTCSAQYNNSHRTISNYTKEKIKKSLKLKNYVEKTKLCCQYCGNDFYVIKSKLHQKCCSRSCAAKLRMMDPRLIEIARQNGIRVSSYNNKRSKNEIYFAELCESRFKKVLLNAPIFNKWDADIIIEDHKIAILWNGKWHYSKITAKHSVKQVQNRDNIKIKEIKNAGYIPYIIKDMGRENKKFVEQEFEKLKIYINTCP